MITPLSQSQPPDPHRDALYDLLRLVADPAGAKKRLDELTAAKVEAAQSIEVAKSVTAKAAADKAQADALLSAARQEAQSHKDRADTRQTDQDRREADLQSLADNLAAAQRDHAVSSTAKDADLRKREDALAFRERHVEDVHRQAEADAKAVSDLRVQLERKLDAIRNAAA